MPPASDLTFRILTDADRDRYDAFVGNHPNHNFCQAWDWGEVKGRGEWSPVRCAVERDGEFAGAAQVLLRPLPLGYALAYASRGPIVDLATAASPERAALVDGLENLCRRRRAVMLKVDPCVTAEQERALLACGARKLVTRDGRFGGTQPRFVMRLDLTPGPDAVFGNFKSDYRNRIRKSERRGIEVRCAESDADWHGFYALLRETAARQSFSVRAESYFQAIREELRGACEARVFLSEREGRMVGGILCVRYGRTVWYLYGGMNDEGRDHYCGYLMQWRAMEWAFETECTVYDFRGVAPPDAVDSPLYGLNKFKSGFSPELVEWVGEYDLVLNPLAYRLVTGLLPTAKRLLKRRAG